MSSPEGIKFDYTYDWTWRTCLTREEEEETEEEEAEPLHRQAVPATQGAQLAQRLRRCPT